MDFITIEPSTLALFTNSPIRLYIALVHALIFPVTLWSPLAPTLTTEIISLFVPSFAGGNAQSSPVQQGKPSLYILVGAVPIS